MQCLLPKAINHPEKLPVSPSVPHPCTHPHVHHMHRYTQHTRMNTHRHCMHPDTRHTPTCATTRPRTHTVHTSSVWTHITHSHIPHTHIHHKCTTQAHRFHTTHTPHILRSDHMCTYVCTSTNVHRNTHADPQTCMCAHTAVIVPIPMRGDKWGP